MNALLVPIFVASLGGSLHCAAMCGPFVGAVTGFGSGGRAAPATHAAYHVGRLGTYLALGAFGGLFGKALDLVGNAAGLARASAIVAGVVLIASGAMSAFSLVARERFVGLRRRAPARLGSLLGSVLARLTRLPPLSRALLLGLSTTLVPCGWLYAFVAIAAGTGNVLSALGVMLVFWLGTLPALAAAGVGLRGLMSRFGARTRAVSASLIALSGLVLLALRLDVPPAHTSASTGVDATPCPLHPQRAP